MWLALCTLAVSVSSQDMLWAMQWDSQCLVMKWRGTFPFDKAFVCRHSVMTLNEIEIARFATRMEFSQLVAPSESVPTCQSRVPCILQPAL